MSNLNIYYINEFSFVTEWFTDTQESFDLLRVEVKQMVEDYLKFIQTLTNSTGIHIKYYGLDGDNVEDEDIIKWKITFEANSSGFITEELIIDETDYYNVIQFSDDQILYTGKLDDCWKFLEEQFPGLDTRYKLSLDHYLKDIQLQYSYSKCHLEL